MPIYLTTFSNPLCISGINSNVLVTSFLGMFQHKETGTTALLAHSAKVTCDSSASDSLEWVRIELFVKLGQTLD